MEMATLRLLMIILIIVTSCLFSTTLAFVIMEYTTHKENKRVYFDNLQTHRETIIKLKEELKRAQGLVDFWVKRYEEANSIYSFNTPSKPKKKTK
jgi:hypothetical protein